MTKHWTCDICGERGNDGAPAIMERVYVNGSRRSQNVRVEIAFKFDSNYPDMCKDCRLRAISLATGLLIPATVESAVSIAAQKPAERSRAADAGSDAPAPVQPSEVQTDPGDA